MIHLIKVITIIIIFLSIAIILAYNNHDVARFY